MDRGRRSVIKAGIGLSISCLWSPKTNHRHRHGKALRGNQNRCREGAAAGNHSPVSGARRDRHSQQPPYGTAEAVVGELVEGLKVRESLFLVTKVSLRNVVGRDAGLKQIEASFKRYRTGKLDLIAVHNLLDTETQLNTLREMKALGRIRYVGITTSFGKQYGECEQVMTKKP